MGGDDAATTEHVQRRRARNKQNLYPYRDRIVTLEDGVSILGCSPRLAPGHTPGHACWWIDTNATPLVAWGDLVHFSEIQFQRPDVVVKYDIDPAQARRTRLALLEHFAEERVTILGAHVSAPGVGQVVKQGAGYAFVPAVPGEVVA
jgi:glyoxylase-like metal-dependent hydrolase (beta-lactamase superfamily II)